ncbi:DUF2637 domain-containing protein [Streptomyces sp. NRRL B-24484]|uniref:DUF2637 domain-containing protein n=1 Tax=Streptomyces sp. NRRL B-24484 TaxID=1463833 RepID=UPI00069475F1|nr:DUF2637 domain-containing protein [Streptomyces sp. NRRL B-24484]
MATAALPLREAGTPAAPLPTQPVPVTAASTSVAAPTTSAAPAATSVTARRTLTRVDVLLLIILGAGAATVAGIGFAGSYNAVLHLAQRKGFGEFSRAFPIGVDAGIVVALAADLYLVRRGIVWPVLRPLAHVLTALTIWFNASSGQHSIRQDPVAAAMHAVMPVLFVVAVEAARFLVVRTAEAEAGRTGVPMKRWILAPAPTFKLWRRMQLWAIPTYAEAAGIEQDRVVYRAMLKRKYGSVRRAPADAQLPLRMARHGLTVEQALMQPQQEIEREQALADARQAAQEAAQERAADRAAQAQIAALKRRGAVQAAEHEVTSSTQQIAIAAKAAKEAAERAAEATSAAEVAALESAGAAEADARKADAEKQAALARKAAAEAEKEAAEVRRQAAETDERAAEAKRRSAQEAAAEAEARRQEEEDKAAAAMAKLGQADALRRAAETEKTAAELREEAALVELRAVEAEDEARLGVRERAARRLARVILAEHGGDAEAMSLEDVAALLGLAIPTASERRREAAELIASGYRPLR